MELLEESIKRKQRNLDMFLSQNLLTEWIYTQIRLIEYNQTTLNILIQTLADCYIDYGSMIREIQISLEDLKKKMLDLEEPYSTFEQGKGFSKEDINKIFKTK